MMSQQRREYGLTHAGVSTCNHNDAAHALIESGIEQFANSCFITHVKSPALLIAPQLQCLRFELPSGVLTRRKIPFILLFTAAFMAVVEQGFCYDAELMGLTALRREHPAVNGAGVNVGT